MPKMSILKKKNVHEIIKEPFFSVYELNSSIILIKYGFFKEYSYIYEIVIFVRNFSFVPH